MDERSEERPRRYRWGIWLPALVLIGSAAVVGWLTYKFLPSSSQGAGSGAGPTSVTVETIHALPKRFVSTVTENAVVMPAPDLPIVPGQVGWVRLVKVTPGQRVSAGEVIAVIQLADDSYSDATNAYQIALQNTAIAQNQLASIQDGLAASQANAAALKDKLTQDNAYLYTVRFAQKQARSDLDNASKSLDQQNKVVLQNRSLYNQGAIAKMDLERSESVQSQIIAQLDSARNTLETSQIEAAEASARIITDQRALADARNTVKKAATASQSAIRLLKQQQSAAAQAKAGMQSAQRSQQFVPIQSPASGVVTSFAFKAGALVTPSAEIARVKPVGSAVVTFDVDDTQVKKLRVGARSVVWAQSRKIHIPGKVTAIPPLANGGVKRNRVFIEAFDVTNNLKPGLKVAAQIELGKVTGLTVPRSAVVPLKDGFSVWTINDGLARAKRIQVTGWSNGRAVVTSGLTTGDAIVIRSSQPLEEGKAVAVSQPGT